MHWELWDIEGGNVVGHRDSEVKVLTLVRELVRIGWPMNALALFAEDESRPADALPLVIDGSDLMQRAAGFGSDPSQQTGVMGPHPADEGFRLFYRIVKFDPPKLFDMQSALVRGYPEPPDPERRAVWNGLSVFSTFSQARRKQRTSPAIGKYIAVLRVPTDGSVRYARTLREAGHHTIWADAGLLLAWVVSVEPA